MCTFLTQSKITYPFALICDQLIVQKATNVRTQELHQPTIGTGLSEPTSCVEAFPHKVSKDSRDSSIGQSTPFITNIENLATLVAVINTPTVGCANQKEFEQSPPSHETTRAV